MILHKGQHGFTKKGYPFTVEAVYLDSKPSRYALLAIELKRPGYYNPNVLHACVDHSGKWRHDGDFTDFDVASVA